MDKLMLDLETLGNGPNACIIQIGACYFDLDGKVGDAFSKNVKPCEGFGFTPSTIMWWMQQDKDLINKMFQDQIHIYTALQQFHEFSKKAKEVWCHATFDFVILMSAYNKVGLESPFHYRAARDIRTLMALSGLPVDKSKRTIPPHDALSDCIFQVGYVTEAWRLILGDA